MPARAAISSEREKNADDIGHDVDRGVGGLAIMHDDHRHAAFGDDAGKLAVALQAPHVVDDRGAGRERPSRDLGLHGVDGDRNAERHGGRQDGRKAPHFLLDWHRYGAAVGAGRFGADIQNVGTLRDHPARLVEGGRWIEKTAAVGKGVGGDVEHAHHDRPAKREQAGERIRRFLVVAGETGNWAHQRHGRRFAPVPGGVSSARHCPQLGSIDT